MSRWLGKTHHATRKAVFKDAIQVVVDRDFLPRDALERRIVAKAAQPALLVQFGRYAWAARSHYVRLWLLCVALFDAALIVFDWMMAPHLLGPALLVRGVGVTAVFALLYVIWGRPLARLLQAATPVLVAVAIMGGAGILGLIGGEVTFERYLTAGLFTVSTGLVFIPVSLRATIAGVATAIAIDAAFVIVRPSGAATPELLMIGFYAAAILSLTGARRAALDGLWRGFLARVREARDQQELTRLNAELRIVAHVDPLTGIPNRRSAQSHIERLWRDGAIRESGVAFVMADIDHFKLLNDSCGHAAGDGCIQAVAAAIRSTLSDGDIVSRHGGEEFLAVLTPATAESAAATAERMRQAVKSLLIPHPGSSVVTISLGVAAADDRFGPERAMRRADEALYAAKRDGRDRVAIAQADAPARGSRPLWSEQAA